MKIPQPIYWIAIIFLLFMWWQSCHKEPEVVQDPQVKAENNKLRDSLKQSRENQQRQDEYIKYVDGLLPEAYEKAYNAKMLLDKANKEVSYWANKVIHDTIHTENCDGLAKAATKAKAECDSTIAAKNEIIDYQNGEIGSYKIIRQSLENDTSDYAKINSNLEKEKARIIKQAQPRRQVFIGIEGGSTQIAFQYVQLGAIYKDKKDNQFKIGAGVMLDGKPVFSGGYYHLFTFKRK